MTRLRESLASVGKQTASGTAQGSYGWTTTKVIDVTPTMGTPEERIDQLEARLVEQRVRLTETLTAAIDQARADDQDASKGARLREIYIAAFGLLVSVAGYICQPA